MGAPGHGFPGGAERKTLDEVSPVAREHELGETGGTRWRKVRNHTAAPGRASPRARPMPRCWPTRRPSERGWSRPPGTPRGRYKRIPKPSSLADAYGFGPKQLQKFFTALQDNTDELERMRAEVDEEYAFEKLRQKAQAVTGMEVHYLYEQEALLAEMQAAKEGVLAHE